MKEFLPQTKEDLSKKNVNLSGLGRERFLLLRFIPFCANSHLFG